jgi:guanine deaminase
MNTCIIRGRTLTFKRRPYSSNDTDSYNFIKDGALFIKNGIISKIGTFSDVKKEVSKDIKIYDHQPRLIIPGFIDTHLHFPQIQIIGSYASNLLEWLKTYTFIEEQKYKDPFHSQNMAKQFFNLLINHGTTTAAVFCTSYPESVEAFFTESNNRNMLMIGGKVMMDQNAPTELLDTPQLGYDDSKKLINKWHKVGRQYYAISPRFAITSTPEQLDMSRTLINEHPDCYLQTHLSENKDEITLAKKLHPNYKDYTGIYEHYNLLGPKSLFGHCIHLSEREKIIMSETKSIAVFCPTSNLFLGSGLFDLQSFLKQQQPVRIAIGTDIGGGTSYSMLKTMDEAYKILQLQNQRLSPIESFYQITLGNAEALSLENKIGTLEVGSDADITVLNANATTSMQLRMEKVLSLNEELFILQTMGDDRSIAQVYINGVASKII